MKNSITTAYITIILLASCSVTRTINTAHRDIKSLHFLGEYIVPYNQQYKGTTIGGLSGIDYDPLQNQYYLISDDRSEFNAARFYTAKISFTQQGITDVQFINVTTLLQQNKLSYPSSKTDPLHTPDPEALRYNPVKDQLYWTSEGERIVEKNIVLEDPAITIINKEGQYLDIFPLPSQMHMNVTEHGPRRNGVFEGLSFADNYKTMYVSVEEPLYDDGPRAGLRDTATWTRIMKYDVDTRLPVAQYAYHLEPIAHPPVIPNQFKINGIPDILSIGKNKLLVIERSFSAGIQVCTIRVYITDVSAATNIANIASLKQQPPQHSADKKLLLNMDDIGIYIDNIEGVTFGPTLANGHKTLIFVSDNNFDKAQKTQLLLFEIVN